MMNCTAAVKKNLNIWFIYISISIRKLDIIMEESKGLLHWVIFKLQETTLLIDNESLQILIANVVY